MHYVFFFFLISTPQSDAVVQYLSGPNRHISKAASFTFFVANLKLIKFYIVYT